ncbi:MAG TPA: hypothetical protein VF883_23470 [Thermoanaerobaculia bacterium]|jgi:hypothetical protein
MNELIATIHFIGLCLFTTAASEIAELRVLLPRVVWSLPTVIGPAEGTSAVSHPDGPADVETHTAFIAFRKIDRKTVTGWVPKPMPGQPDYEYIVLSGETVTFERNAKNRVPKKPDLPRLLSCPGSKLRSNVAGPNASDVAATFVLNYGDTSTCRSLPHGHHPPASRIDTKLRLNNTGTLTITGKAGQTTRTLTVDGGATVYVGNLPSKLLRSNPVPIREGSGAHHLAYYGMFTNDPAAAACEYQRLADDAASRGRCGIVDFRFGDSADPPPLEGFKHAINSDCSNSSWP